MQELTSNGRKSVTRGVEVLKVARDVPEGSKLRAPAEKAWAVGVLYHTEHVRPQTGSQENSNGYTVSTRLQSSQRSCMRQVVL